MPKKEKLEHSEFAGEFTDDDVTVLVDIFRPSGTNGDWTMQVITQDEDLISGKKPSRPTAKPSTNFSQPSSATASGHFSMTRTHPDPLSAPVGDLCRNCATICRV